MAWCAFGRRLCGLIGRARIWKVSVSFRVTVAWCAFGRRPWCVFGRRLVAPLAGARGEYFPSLSACQENGGAGHIFKRRPWCAFGCFPCLWCAFGKVCACRVGRVGMVCAALEGASLESGRPWCVPRARRRCALVQGGASTCGARWPVPRLGDACPTWKVPVFGRHRCVCGVQGAGRACGRCLVGATRGRRRCRGPPGRDSVPPVQGAGVCRV